MDERIEFQEWLVKAGYRVSRSIQKAAFGRHRGPVILNPSDVESLAIHLQRLEAVAAVVAGPVPKAEEVT